MDCVPVLVKKSGFQFNKDFFVGHSSERINAGDKSPNADKILNVIFECFAQFECLIFCEKP